MWTSARVVALLLLLHPHPIPASDMLKSWPFMLDSGLRTNNDDEPGFTAEKWGTNHVQTESTDEHRTITVRGNNRVYAVEDINVRNWAEVRYHKFPILDKQLSFSVDLSGVNCGCNAAVYLVAMPARGSADPKNPAAYCDIQGYDRGIPACVELDVLEGNAKAIQTTLHTFRGHGVDGSCNQDGCVANWGKAHNTAHLYGPGAQEGVDSSRPFEVVASFKEMEDWQSQHTLGAVAAHARYPNGRLSACKCSPRRPLPHRCPNGRLSVADGTQWACAQYALFRWRRGGRQPRRPQRAEAHSARGSAAHSRGPDQPRCGACRLVVEG